MQVDLLIPYGTVGEPEIVNGRGFDAIPGLSFALSAEPVRIDATVLLLGGKDLRFTVPVPDVEAALVLKALAWNSRAAEKDLTDISSLLEILNLHKAAMPAWGFAQPRLAAQGQRKDAALALHRIVELNKRGRLHPDKSRATPARIAALIREHIPAP